MLKAQLKSIFVKKPFEKRFKIHGLCAEDFNAACYLICGVDIILRKLAYIFAGLRVRRNENAPLSDLTFSSVSRYA